MVPCIFLNTHEGVRLYDVPKLQPKVLPCLLVLAYKSNYLVPRARFPLGQHQERG